MRPYPPCLSWHFRRPEALFRPIRSAPIMPQTVTDTNASIPYIVPNARLLYLALSEISLFKSPATDIEDLYGISINQLNEYGALPIYIADVGS